MEKRCHDRRMPTPIPERRRGRPRASEPGSSVSTWIPAKDHDRLIELSNRCGQKVSETVRQILILSLR